MQSSAQRLLVCTMAILTLSLMSTQLQAQRRVSPHGFRVTYPGAVAIGLQGGSNWNYGINGPAAFCDCAFESGSDLSYHAGIHLDFYLNRWFGLRLQGLYEDQSTVYTKDWRTTVFRADGSQEDVELQRRSEVDAQYASISFHALWLTGAGGLYVLTGAEAGFFLDGSYLEEEFITTEDLVFTGGSSHRILADESLDASTDVYTRAVLVLGAGYDIALARGAALAPEIQIGFPLTSVVKGNSDWRLLVFRGGLNIRFGI